MHIPVPGVIDDPSVRLHQSRNDPFYGPARIFAPQIESANQMEQVVREKAHLQPDFVRHEAVATRFVPAQRVLACLDPVSFTISVGVRVRKCRITQQPEQIELLPVPDDDGLDEIVLP